ncbi:phosphotransferase [Microbacterium sp. CJ88]|uniref:phosphotransferase n=1 Tax=Microbacterium sp. CJ88 TaxID=3445672 RepID=UPI003F65A6A9
MARSPLTLAATVASALPRAGVVGVGLLTERSTGRYDSAVADLDDGRRVVVRAPVDAADASELAAEARALRALTPGVRALLPFRAPELLGETGLKDARAVVVDFLPGYRVDAAHVPPGHGAATSIGEALAALHALPLSIVRTEGLPSRTPQQVRDDVSRLIDRAEATGRTPSPLVSRWRRAVASDPLWRFESAVVLGGASAASFLFEDVDEVPTVTGMLDWHGLSVGDPATDLQWLASAPNAAEDVFGAYTAQSGRAPDALVRERARMYAELEFAKWLVHGFEAGREDIVADAVGLLDALTQGVDGDELVADAALDLDSAIALLGRTPEQRPADADTSMQTDTYDPALLSLFIAAEEDDAEHDDDRRESADDDLTGELVLDTEALTAARDEAHTAEPEVTAAAGDLPVAAARAVDAPAVDSSPDALAPGDDVSTAPIDIRWARSVHLEDDDPVGDADRSAEAALRRWTQNRD